MDQIVLSFLANYNELVFYILFSFRALQTFDREVLTAQWNI